MNRFQEVWWRQANSDHEVLVLMRRDGVPPCHCLHYLQMVTEKLAKAYFWRSGVAPPRSHAGFVQFLRFLGQTPHSCRERVAMLFTFRRFADFQGWIRSILPIAYDLERLAPVLASDGPNPEYPWPHDAPQIAPVDHRFEIWKDLLSGQGRDMLRFVEIAIRRFPEYADV